jgi:hypothetical protein
VANPNPPTDHLSPWKPGQSGNPAGRPKGRTVGAVLRDRLAAIPDDDERPLADRVTDVIVREALAGDIRFVELLLNRTEGKVPQPITGEKTIVVQRVDRGLVSPTPEPDEGAE